MGILLIITYRNYPNWKSWALVSPVLIYGHFKVIQNYGTFYYPNLFDENGVFQLLLIVIPELFNQGVGLCILSRSISSIYKRFKEEDLKEKEERKNEKTKVIKNRELGLNDPLPSGIR